MIDKYIVGKVERVSPEAPILVLRANASRSCLGGAANVAAMCRALGAHVELAGLVGPDSAGDLLRHLLFEQTIGADCVLSSGRRTTTVKERYLGSGPQRQPQQVLRVDWETEPSADEQDEFRLLDKLVEQVTCADALLISDYGKGSCTPGIVERMVMAAKAAHVPVLVDPGKHGDWRCYRQASLIKPNRAEAARFLGSPIHHVDQATEAARGIREALDVDSVIITLDSDGLILLESDNQVRHYPAVHREVCDVTGAGDMVLAMVGCCVAQGLSLDESAHLANVAAGLEIQRIGTVPVSWAEVVSAITTGPGSAKVVSLADMLSLREKYRSGGKRVIFTNGCFDLLHIGHVTDLQEAASLGDVLIVAINSDASVKRLKGASRPIIEEHNRAAMLAALGCVDHVLLFAEDTPCSVLESLRPDVLVKGGTYSVDEILGRDIVEQYGGRVCTVGKVDDVSTTRILASITSRMDSTPAIDAPKSQAD